MRTESGRCIEKGARNASRKGRIVGKYIKKRMNWRKEYYETSKIWRDALLEIHIVENYLH